jgi:hypothetical protein
MSYLELRTLAGKEKAEIPLIWPVSKLDWSSKQNRNNQDLQEVERMETSLSAHAL